MKHYFALIALGVALVSCNKMLDLTPTDQVSSKLRPWASPRRSPTR